MDTYAESTSDISNFSVAVNGRQQTETVNQQAIGFFHFFFRSLRVTHYGTVQLADDFLQMAFINHVRCNNQLYLRMRIEIRNENILIRSPGTAGYESSMVSFEFLYQWKFLGLTANLQHPVKTCITYYSGVGNTDGTK